MIYFTELSNSPNTKNSDEPIIFQFFDRELPEGLAFPIKTKLNKIEYPGGFQTAQIIGRYQGDIEWDGTLYGTYFTGTETITAKERFDDLATLVGRPLRVGFPVPGCGTKSSPEPFGPGVTTSSDYAGDIYEVIIEELIPTIYSYVHIEYKIKLTPHQRQEKIRPISTSVVQIRPDFSNIAGGAKKTFNSALHAKGSIKDKAHQSVSKAKEYLKNTTSKSSGSQSFDFAKTNGIKVDANGNVI